MKWLGILIIALILFSSGFLHQAQLPIENSRHTMEAIIEGYGRGKTAQGLLGRDWKKEWSRDLNDLRKELGISTPQRAECSA